MAHKLNNLAGHFGLKGRVGRFARAYLARPYSSNAKCRVAIYFQLESICFAQIFPFLFYADVIRERYGAEIRCFQNSDLEAGKSVRADNADVVLFQTWFDSTQETMSRCFESLRAAHPTARFAFLDGFAHSDIRLARFLEPEIDFYIKKSLFRDKEQFFQPFQGGTNLTEFYGKLYDIHADPVDWQVPPSILPKLRLCPNFFVAPQFLGKFSRGALPAVNDRPFDVQTRFGVRGLDWYQAMRTDALERMRAIQGLSLSANDRVSYSAYMKEMQHSKLCFSPHGYGELCWRDVEGVLAGAALIKPDMSHLESLPDLYEPGVTYMPVKWDFSDLEDVVRRLLEDAKLRADLTRNASLRITDYVQNASFVDDISFLFDG